MVFELMRELNSRDYGLPTWMSTPSNTHASHYERSHYFYNGSYVLKENPLNDESCITQFQVIANWNEVVVDNNARRCYYESDVYCNHGRLSSVISIDLDIVSSIAVLQLPNLEADLQFGTSTAQHSANHTGPMTSFIHLCLIGGPGTEGIGDVTSCVI